jgi:hypothetical protein
MHEAIGGKPSQSTNAAGELYQSGDARFWYGALMYGESERETALRNATAKKSDRLEFADSGKKSAARLAFEGRTGKFLTRRQFDIIEAMKPAGTQRGVQVNMGDGKSAVIVPVLVLEMLEDHDVVVVTQPEHLVPAAFRIIGSTVAARPFIKGRAIVVTLDA